MAVDANNTPVPDSETSPNDAGLLPCPFCGSDDLLVREALWINCRTCEAEGPNFSGLDAITAWNIRTSKAVTP